MNNHRSKKKTFPNDGKMRRCEEMRKDVERCGEKQRDAEICGDMWRDVERCGKMRRDVEMLGGQNLRCRGFIQRQNTGLESFTYAQVLFLIIKNTFAHVYFENLMPLCKILFFYNYMHTFCKSYALMQKIFL